MTDTRIIKRYGAYYHGWCLAFGEHEADFREENPVNWLFGKDKVGLILASDLRRKLQHELLGKQAEIPELIMSTHLIRTKHQRYELGPDIDKKGIQSLKELFLDSQDIHMFLCSHFIYSPRTRIITFTQKKPTPIMYKEMPPLKLVIE